ncbi:hypothetical protein [Nocardioides sp. R-C-SC26]|uniref:hypothetical protein n=1 Tax=Nocardioides sp. R-C-SC26 TaxID=2870414 RepID=UPI001E437868|nr:hypothetical protein [Nocardioides sp. R-C-SC26]
MSPFSTHVLGIAAILASPALWQGFVTGEIGMDVAVTRYLIVLGVVWVGLSALAMLVGSPPAPAAATSEVDTGPGMSMTSESGVEHAPPA